MAEAAELDRATMAAAEKASARPGRTNIKRSSSGGGIAHVEQ